MAKELTTVAQSGYTSLNKIGDYKQTIDATGDTAPDTLEALLAAYGSCFVPALRVAGQQRGVDDLGRIEIDVMGEQNDDDKLGSISFEVRTETDIDEETVPEILERATELCKVHDALREELHAEISLDPGSA